MIKKLLMLVVVGASLSGCIGADPVYMSQTQKKSLRDDALKEVASREMNCPADAMKFSQNELLMKGNTKLTDEGLAFMVYDAYGCGLKKSYILQCGEKPKIENASFHVISTMTMGVILPIKLECTAEPLSVNDTTNAQSKPEDRR